MYVLLLLYPCTHKLKTKAPQKIIKAVSDQNFHGIYETGPKPPALTIYFLDIFVVTYNINGLLYGYIYCNIYGNSTSNCRIHNALFVDIFIIIFTIISHQRVTCIMLYSSDIFGIIFMIISYQTVAYIMLYSVEITYCWSFGC